MVCRFLLLLQLGPGRGVVVAAAVALCLIQGLQLRGQGAELMADRLEPLLLLGLVLLKVRVQESLIRYLLGYRMESLSLLQKLWKKSEVTT